MYEAPYYEYGVPTDVTTPAVYHAGRLSLVNVEDQLPMLLTATIGNISMVPNFKLLDMRIPKATLDQFNGPQVRHRRLVEGPGHRRRVVPCSTT